MKLAKEKHDTLPARSNGKHPGGRPTRYTPQILRNAKHYLAHYEELGHAIPSIASMARHLDISRERLAIWGNDKDKKEFSRILSKLKSEQESVLLHNGLTGNFNSAITKLVLSKHGYSDNQDKQGVSVTVNVDRNSVQVETQGQVIDLPEDTTE